MKENKKKISCLTFQKQKSEIKILTDKINKAKGIQGKALYAEELQKEVDVLLSCSDYDGNILECKNCRFIANLRKKTTNLIIKTKKLG